MARPLRTDIGVVSWLIALIQHLPRRQDGWQTRIAGVLRGYVAKHRLSSLGRTAQRQSVFNHSCKSLICPTRSRPPWRANQAFSCNAQVVMQAPDHGHAQRTLAIENL